MPKSYLILMIAGNLLGAIEAASDGDRSLTGILACNFILYILILTDVIDFIN